MFVSTVLDSRLVTDCCVRQRTGANVSVYTWHNLHHTSHIEIHRLHDADLKKVFFLLCCLKLNSKLELVNGQFCHIDKFS